MPLVRIALRKGTAPDFRRKLSDSVHRAMVETIQVPPLDKFQVITEHDAEGLVYNPSYLDIARTDGVVFIQITLSAGLTLEAKKALYARIAELLRESCGVRPEDVFITLVEVVKENWSFGNGIAQYAT